MVRRDARHHMHICNKIKEFCMKNKRLMLGILVLVLVFGMTVVGCASYMKWYYSTLPGGKEQHDRQMQEINERNKSGGSSSSGSSSSSVVCICGSMCSAGWISSTEYRANADGCTNSGCRVRSAIASGEAARDQPTLSCNCH